MASSTSGTVTTHGDSRGGPCSSCAGSAPASCDWSSRLVRHLQSGYVYHYAFTMIVGVFVLLYWWGVR
jgi:hypothetical protein